MKDVFDLLEDYGLEFHMKEVYSLDKEPKEVGESKQILKHLLSNGEFVDFEATVKDSDKVKKAFSFPGKYDVLTDVCFEDIKVRITVNSRDEFKETRVFISFVATDFLHRFEKRLLEDVENNPEKYGLSEERVKLYELFEPGRKSKEKMEEITQIYIDFLKDDKTMGGGSHFFCEHLERILKNQAK